METLANGTYRVELANGYQLTAFVPEKTKRSLARLQSGDEVKLQLTPYDLSSGRILTKIKTI
jgi:translation initiation factor IF-1